MNGPIEQEQEIVNRLTFEAALDRLNARDRAIVEAHLVGSVSQHEETWYGYELREIVWKLACVYNVTARCASCGNSLHASAFGWYSWENPLSRTGQRTKRVCLECEPTCIRDQRAMATRWKAAVESGETWTCRHCEQAKPAWAFAFRQRKRCKDCA